MILVLFTASCASVKGQQPGLLRTEFIYETAPFPSCHASTIAETRYDRQTGNLCNAISRYLRGVDQCSVD